MAKLRGMKDIKFTGKSKEFYYFEGWRKKQGCIAGGLFEYNNSYYQAHSSSIICEGSNGMRVKYKIGQKEGQPQMMRDGLYLSCWSAYQLIPCSPWQLDNPNLDNPRKLNE